MKPILFNTEMVRAILDGRKTVTRRVVKGANPLWCFDGMETNPAMAKVRKNGEKCPVDMPGLWALFEWDGYPEYPMVKAPYQPGSILYVREAWCQVAKTIFWYRADCAPALRNILWRPSIHMPREAARIFLRVTDVRVARLKDITPEQIDAEGCKEYGYSVETGELMPSSPCYFSIVWDGTIRKADRALYGWAANPWVWVIEFEQISREEAMRSC